MNIYCQHYLKQIQKIALKNKYTDLYIKICLNSVKRKMSKEQLIKEFKYIEAHHIIPKSFNLVDEKILENQIYLTAREHFLCHRFLAKMFEDPLLKKKMNAAVFMMCNKKYMVSSRVYETLRNNHSNTNITSLITRKKLSESHKNLIWIKKESTNEYMRVSKNIVDQFYMAGFINGRKKREKYPKQSELSKQKISTAHKKRIKILCKYCNKLFSKHMHTRWHGEKCFKKAK